MSSSPFSPEQQKVLTEKIGVQITEQLGEPNDMLVEYVMVMCNDGKETAAVEADLVELIGEEPAATFSAWLSATQGAILSEHADEAENEPANDGVEWSASVQQEEDVEEDVEADGGDDSKNEQEEPPERVRQGGLSLMASHDDEAYGLVDRRLLGYTEDPSLRTMLHFWLQQVLILEMPSFLLRLTSHHNFFVSSI